MIQSWKINSLFKFKEIVDSCTLKLLPLLIFKINLVSYLPSFFLAISKFNTLPSLVPKHSGFTNFTPFEKICAKGLSRKALIFDIYTVLNSLPEDPFPKLHVKMGKSAGMWICLYRIGKHCGFQAHMSSMCTKFKENAYEILMHWYYTPKSLHFIYPTVSDYC